jgi:hypothetical protein
MAETADCIRSKPVDTAAGEQASLNLDTSSLERHQQVLTTYQALISHEAENSKAMLEEVIQDAEIEVHSLKQALIAAELRIKQLKDRRGKIDASTAIRLQLSRDILLAMSGGNLAALREPMSHMDESNGVEVYETVSIPRPAK